ncbi:transcriptional regulator [Amycolatopsis sp. NBRC 101858]|uniref:HigA family addiction module antitoxin n=1 Tax=Amycolatopsis sp. NBRC 101858 TaxID=3032200 RepID=UPI0024A2731F|nr:HigA family addiction module antitoxin [Amycolatopsis sp. NBRC 101858]GLY38862.1 transcriptional regulator [Amycolatopsis sp. NBRC 101858]
MNSRPVEAFPVGDFLLEELARRGWTQAEFAEIIDRPPQVVSEIVAGKKEITRESAAQISAALETSPEYWLGLQDSFHLWQQAQDERIIQQLDDVRLRALLNQQAPLALLRKRGVITASTLREQSEQLCELLEIENIKQKPTLKMAARRSNVAESVSSIQVAWLACVRRQARRRSVAAYSQQGLRSLAERLSRDVRNPFGFADLPARFAEVGVCLVYVEAFPGSKIDGASFEMDGVPVIGLSGRGHRLDKVLFTLLHEVAHVDLNHIADGVILDEDNPHGRQQEDDANELAAQWALPGWLPEVPDRIGQGWLARIADTFGVHPIVIVGRLQKLDILTWRSALAKNAPSVAEHLRSW